MRSVRTRWTRSCCGLSTTFSSSCSRFEVFRRTLWAVAIGLAILLDDSQRPVFPRYAAWVNFWFAGLVMTGQFMIFFKTGPLAWNGLLALYWPAAVFFIWICIMSALVIQGVKRGDGVVEGASQDRYPSAPIEPMLVRVAAHNGSGQAGT